MLTDRITAQHLRRAAIVYVRQSSPEQVRSHAESTRIQIGLRDKAAAFGWPKPVTIVDDLGVSTAGFAHRAGFQHMVTEVSLGHVGIILCFEASRLSRNSKDWAQLFELRTPRHSRSRSRSGLRSLAARRSADPRREGQCQRV
jgi:DNA invertase Pin-like site-specific DNA recombinase